MYNKENHNSGSSYSENGYDSLKEVPFRGEKEKDDDRLFTKKAIAGLLAVTITVGGLFTWLSVKQGESLDRSLEKSRKQVEAYEEEKAEYQATPEGQAELQTKIRNEQTEEYDAIFDENRQNIEEAWENDDTTTFMDGPSE